MLMESFKEKGIRFTKKCLTPEAKYNCIHSETKSIEGLDEIGLIILSILYMTIKSYKIFYKNLC